MEGPEMEGDVKLGTDIPFLFNPKDHDEHPSTRQKYFGLGEIFMGSFSIDGYNASWIAVNLDKLPDGNGLRLTICDNGTAHDDTVPACYNNAVSLVAERSPTRDATVAVGAGSSKHGTGARRGAEAREECGPLVRSKAEQGAERKVKGIIATFDVESYLSCEWRNTKLPLMKFKDYMIGKMEHPCYETANLRNLRSFIPLRETADPRDPEEVRKRTIERIVAERNVVPLECHPEKCFRQLVRRFADVKGENTGFATAILQPYGGWKVTEHRDDIHFSATATPNVTGSIRRMVETGFLQPAWNFDDLLELSREATGPNDMKNIVSALLATPDNTPGHDVRVQINDGPTFKVGLAFEKMLALCQRDRQILFVHRSSSDDAIVIGVRPTSVKPMIADVLPPDLLLHQRPATTHVPVKAINDGSLKDEKLGDRCGVLALHFAHNKAFLGTMHRNPEEWYRTNHRTLLKTSIKHYSKILCSAPGVDTRDYGMGEDGHLLPVAYRGKLSEQHLAQLAMLSRRECGNIVHELLFQNEVPIVLFVFAKHTLLDNSKTSYKDFNDDFELRILPEALREGYFGPLIDAKRLQIEAADARKAEARLQKEIPAPPTTPPAPVSPELSTPCKPRQAAKDALIRIRRPQEDLDGHGGPQHQDGTSISSFRAQKRSVSRQARKKRPRPSAVPLHSFGIDVPGRVKATHKAMSTLVKNLGGASSSDSLVGRWVAIDYKDDGRRGDQVDHWVAMVLGKITNQADKNSYSDWYSVYFSGIGWDCKGRPFYKEEENPNQEVDMNEDMYHILESDPLAE
eukprot:CAMPEP_0117696466 /NCGR_PEP_ID=MMETSP0804-20121206/28692_1 /TAXON_ID=1074897 /ORGANISM="Tetraselmis astigmatica, Strain CCMP880" /LENGTH=798 /DNA_ID=CAMNT_0005510615 /DNA_START=71 /DNA_END=2468 /DNA_ORIENTATION=+